MKGETDMARDPVCGMEVQPEQSAGQSEHDGKTYYFCCQACKQRFDQDPRQYIDSQSTAGSRG